MYSMRIEPLDPGSIFFRLLAPTKRKLFGMMFFFLIVFLVAGGVSASNSSLDPAFCRALVKHVPDADVTYQPGMDVHGKPVAPADLPDSPAFQLQQPITIPLTADLFKILNFSTTGYPFNTMRRTDINLGTLMVDGDKVLYNGQPLTSEQQDDLAVLCLKPDGTAAPQKTTPVKVKP
jgi:hypothetical protein